MSGRRAALLGRARRAPRPVQLAAATSEQSRSMSLGAMPVTRPYIRLPLKASPAPVVSKMAS
eukprot:scaffold499328_cov53-Prasinocladus_malaysianus.AAC.1